MNKATIAILALVLLLPSAAQAQPRISEWAKEFNVYVVPYAERPDSPSGPKYVIKDIFTTVDGSWEPSDKPGSIPQWARDEYLTAEFDDAGGDHHFFIAVENGGGNLLPNFDVIFWSDGLEKLADPTYDGYVERQTKTHSGWINIPMFPGSTYYPDLGEEGPWCVTAASGVADVICGVGLPYQQHISTFVVLKRLNNGNGTIPPVDLEPMQHLPFMAR
jgi:hypothetical protein